MAQVRCAGVRMSLAQPVKGCMAAGWLLEPRQGAAAGSHAPGKMIVAFRLHMLQQQSPEQRLLRLLTQQQWQEALNFAAGHNLSADHVYRLGLAWQCAKHRQGLVP